MKAREHLAVILASIGGVFLLIALDKILCNEIVRGLLP